MVCESTISSAPGGLRDPARHLTPLTRHRRRRTCGLGGPGRARWKITASGPFETFHNVGWPGILIMTTRPGERDGAGQTSLGTPGRGAARPRVGAAAGRASACTPKITASGPFGSSNNLGWPGILIMTRRLSTTARAVARQTAPPATPEHGRPRRRRHQSTADRAAGDTRARQTAPPATPEHGRPRRRRHQSTADRAAGDTRARQTAPPATPEHGRPRRRRHQSTADRAAGDTRARQTAPPATPEHGRPRRRRHQSTADRAAGDTRARQTAPPATPEHGRPRRRRHQGTADRAAGDTRARQTLAPATPGRGGSVAHGAVDAQGRSALPDFRTPATGSRCYSSARVVLASVSSSANAPRIASSESLTCEASVTPSVSTPASAAVVLNSNSLA